MRDADSKNIPQTLEADATKALRGLMRIADHVYGVARNEHNSIMNETFQQKARAPPVTTPLSPNLAERRHHLRVTAALL